MNLLFLHQNFPGQFRHLAAHFAVQPSSRVIAIGEQANVKRATGLHPRIELRPYQLNAPGGDVGHPYVKPYEAAVTRGLTVAKVMTQLKREGFTPDLIVAHPGWGEALFVRDVFPTARLVEYAEFFYQATGADVGFDPEFSTDEAEAPYRLRIKNTTQLISMEQADRLISPTQWQKSHFPDSLQSKMDVVHDGVDTSIVRPNPDAMITLAKAGISLGAGDEVVTYVARNLEPYRGFHIFMRSLPRLLAMRPMARVLVVGGDAVSYGTKAPDGRNWRQAMMTELGASLDIDRVHFLGRLPYASYLQVLQVSAVHVYLTYPFVLSWSMLEAMASGCILVASKTAPVEEVIEEGTNGWLTDFFDHQALAVRVAEALQARQKLGDLKTAARQTIVDRYDLRTKCLPRQVALLDSRSP